ncbi:MAG: glutamate synthase large subunit [Acidobacteria bacterium]|nr:glutamate synthase large subunit [Acidobacteriota bacterium]
MFDALQRAHPPLYSPDFEHDACGVGFVASINGHSSRTILDMGIHALDRLAHRGAVDADDQTGDGAGVLTQLPYKILAAALAARGIAAIDPSRLAVGMLFLPPDDMEAQQFCRTAIENAMRIHHLSLLGYREVPVELSALGPKGAATRPYIEQVLLARPEGMSGAGFARALYLTRKAIEARTSSIERFYIPSLSHKTIVYKGLMTPAHLPEFYRDLQDPLFETAMVLFHQRYSTNTFPNWSLAHPFRMVAHNGEINTIKGNRHWMAGREAHLPATLWDAAASDQLRPIVQPGRSDSAGVDNVLEFLTHSNRTILRSAAMMFPEAYETVPGLSADLKAFYDYHAPLMEPWDGPAAVIFSDGAVVGAALDRNGLRPARYQVTDDGLLSLASEVGVFPIDPARVVSKGRLGPGQMIAVNMEKGIILDNSAMKAQLAGENPYGDWVRRRMVPVEVSLYDIEAESFLPEQLLRQQKTFGYTAEDLERMMKPMGLEAKEAIGSMGDDTPLSVLAQKTRSLFTYFKQLFAQVTNPPIDPLREKLVMSLTTFLGNRGQWLVDCEENATGIKLKTPILTRTEVAWLQSLTGPTFRSKTLPCLFDASEGSEALAVAISALCETAAAAVREGNSILILTDRPVSPDQAPIPMLMAVGAVHHHMIRSGLRGQASLVVETGCAFEEHHCAALLGYGANALYPYLAFATMAAMVSNGDVECLTARTILHNYKLALENGLLKIMSKMGISTLSSYRGAQLFEALGLSAEIIDRCFPGTPSRIGGIGFKDLAQELLLRHASAFESGSTRLEDAGVYRFRADGEYHAFNPQVFKALHQAVRQSDYEGQYRLYRELVEKRPPTALRDLLQFRTGTPIPLAEVEPVEEIVRRFVTSAMSHGALSREAHETLAAGANRVGARSNSGEGGEDPRRFRSASGEDRLNSAVKQVASGRFGVTTEYLMAAQELQIKIAQGSKPGEGGQLPGHKVSAEIAAIRHSVPGVSLISPPPHHDIYSIEDLAQLIYDLRQVNPRARISVKLVAEAGVGTVAAGVAKAHADTILISGYDGGTGASPLGSIKNVGVPWELGLAEAQQILRWNGLRSRVRLQVDGGLKTGRDVVVAALLGAEEFGFGAAAVVALGCVMARQCHMNTCPKGIATQREELRGRFDGKPEHLINFLRYVARETREILATLGFRTMEEIVGRADLLEPKSGDYAPINLSQVLATVDHDAPRRLADAAPRVAENPLNERLVMDSRSTVIEKRPIFLEYLIRNTDRAIGARLAGEIAQLWGNRGLPENTIECYFRGSAGQSFGAFCVPGMTLVLIGEANDYVGKSMTGGVIAIRPPAEATFVSHENVLLGNTVLYGATGGELYAAGRAGERFAVRNSGAMAIVEGVGDHGCEYMTGGTVLVLGETGKNFAAGMTGGTVYVLDETERFQSHCNKQTVEVLRLTDFEEIDRMRGMIERHHKQTQSARAAEVLSQWDNFAPMFWKVQPKSATASPTVKVATTVYAEARPSA